MRSDDQSPSDGDSDTRQSSILDDTRQRRILALLDDRPLTVRDLVVQLAARESGTDPTRLSADDRRAVRLDLYHRCLPKLDAADWIERHPEGIVVTDTAPVGDEDTSLPALEESAPHLWDAVGALRARPRRRDIVSVIASRDHPLTLAELTSELKERIDSSETPRWDRTDSLTGALHHVDLPKLADIGLIEYDADEKTIARRPALLALVDRLDRCDDAVDTS